MSTMIPAWASGEVSAIIGGSEKIIFVGDGRLEALPPSGLRAILYWFSFLFTNYLSIFATARFMNRAAIVVTDSRVIIVSERAWNFPFWVISLSRRLYTESIALVNVATISTVNSKFMWVLSANGLQVECNSGSIRIVNGLNVETMTAARGIIKN